jgi:hypothetical protein
VSGLAGVFSIVAIKRSYLSGAACIMGAMLLAGGMAMREPDGPVRMSAMKVSNLYGYEVLDSTGARVGEIAAVETDDQGRTRWLRIGLDTGGVARVASFRADLDASHKLVSVRLSEDLLMQRAEAASSPST